MGINRKGKRKITVNSKEYLWWVYHEQDQSSFDGDQIKIVAADQAMYFHYGLQQFEGDRYVLMALHHEAGSISLPCPKFENENGIITPAGISKLINWCKQEPNAEYKREIVHSWSSKNWTLDEAQTKLLYKKLRGMID